MDKSKTEISSAELIDDSYCLSLSELCRVCGTHAEHVAELVAEGVLEPSGQIPTQWRFNTLCLRRVKIVVRLQRDLKVNTAGAALAVELIEELERLRQRQSV